MNYLQKLYWHTRLTTKCVLEKLKFAEFVYEEGCHINDIKWVLLHMHKI